MSIEFPLESLTEAVRRAQAAEMENMELVQREKKIKKTRRMKKMAESLMADGVKGMEKVVKKLDKIILRMQLE